MTITEILIKAGADTLLGMGTVFAMLILISLVIYLFKFISKEESPIDAEPKKEEVQTGKGENEQLIAVIMAAIEAFNKDKSDMGQDGGYIGYMVKSVKRRR